MQAKFQEQLTNADAKVILDTLPKRIQEAFVINQSDCWTDQDIVDVNNFSLQYAATLFSEDEEAVE